MRKQIANELLSIGAVELRPNDPFTWTSGVKAPIYCDNRLTMSYPYVRKAIARGLMELIHNRYKDVQVVAGTATAGIPHCAWVAEQLEIPMVYVRSSAKGHGKQNLIEGKVTLGQKAVVVEDLISTGKSSLQAVRALREAGFEVLGVVAIFSYNFEQAERTFQEENVSFETLTDYQTLIELAEENGTLTNEEKRALTEWNPFSD